MRSRSTVLGLLVMVCTILIIPDPDTPPFPTECFSSTSLESQLGPYAYVEGRAFFGTFRTHDEAVAHAQKVGACVETGGLVIEERDMRHRLALRWAPTQGYAVVGTDTTDHFNRVRVAWKELDTGTIHHSMWLERHVLFPSMSKRMFFDDDNLNVIDGEVHKLNADYNPRYVFWVEEFI